jgi:ferredoxin
MFEIKINNQAVQVSEGETILTVARREGISIPTMCWIKDYKPSTSCMVCLVEDKKTGRMHTACSSLVQEGMEIETDNHDVLDMRRSALDLLLSEHYGDCEAPCQRSCPAEMDIPLMNRLIATGQMTKALNIVKETIALPGILGYICPAPCEKACRRKDIDEPIAICQLKRFVAENDIENPALDLVISSNLTSKTAIIGAGPAGLAAAYYLGLKGMSCTIFDNQQHAGGKMRTDISDDKLPKSVLDAEIDIIRSLKVEFRMNTTITANDIHQSLSNEFDYILLTIGADTTIQTEKFQPTELSEQKDLHIFKVGKSWLFAPRQIPQKSKMAVRAAALGRKCGSWIMEFDEHRHVAVNSRRFNSAYKRIQEDERLEFLKESLNHQGKETTPRWLDGFRLEQAIREAQRCLHCDCRKKEKCVLRDLSTHYKASQRTFTLDKFQRVSKNTGHGLIVLEALKCIKCGICIQTAEQSGDTTGFAFRGRGFDTRIAIPIERNIQQLSNKTALACAASCPTGAISLKDKV